MGITTDDTWHGGIRLDLSGDIGSIITEVAYYDWGENATSVQAHVAEESGGAPGSWIASSEEYVPEGAGWVELELDEPVEIETPGEYWIVLEIEDMGGGHFPFGCISPYVIDGQYMNFDDPQDPDDWDDLKDDGIGGAWSLEARVEHVETLPPTEISSSTVTFNGDLRADPAEVYFKYREKDDPAWIETTPVHAETGEFNQIVRGLSNLTEYEFKAVAEIEHGTEEVEVEGDPLTVVPGYVSRTTQLDEEWDEYHGFGDELRIEDHALKLDTEVGWTETYGYEGETGDGPSETVDVSDVAEIDVKMSGAGGGGDMWSEGAGGYDGGDGGYVEATFDVSEFEQINIWVGEGGEGGEEFEQSTGGWGRASGGDGYEESYEDDANASTGAGGGSTEIWAGDGTPLAAADAGGGGGSYFELIGYLEHGGGGGARAGSGGTGDDGVGEDADPADPEWTSDGYGGDGGDYANNLHGGPGGGEVNSDHLVGDPQIEIGEGKSGGSAEGQSGSDASVEVSYREHHEQSSRRCEPLSMEGVEDVKDSLIVWESSEPLGTSLEIYTAVTDGPEQFPDDWDLAVDGDSIPSIEEGDNLTEKYLWVRQDLSTTDLTVTPELHEISVVVEESGIERYDLTINEPEPVAESGTTYPEPGTYSLYDEGYEVPIRAISEGNWTFSHWMGDYPDGEQEQEEITIVMDDDKEVTPYFEDIDEEVEYNLTIEVAGEGTTEPEEGNHTFFSGEAVPVKAEPAEGHVFDEWTGDVPAGEEEEITIIMDENKSITANFLEMFKLTVNMDGEGNVTDHEGFEFEDGDTKNFTQETEVTLTADAADHWYFEAWTGDETGTEDTITFEMDSDKQITAVFEEVEHTLTVNIEGEGMVEDHEEFEFEDGETKDYVYGTEVTLTAEAADHWYFEEWTGNETGTEETINITMDEDKEITAVFMEEEYTITVDIEGEGNVTDHEGYEFEDGETKEYTQMTEVTLTAEAADHWYFEEWIGNETGTEETIKITMDSDKQITAVFMEEDYTLTVNIEGEGTVEDQEEFEFEDGGTKNYTQMTEVTLTAEAADHWYFEEWTGDATGTDEEITLTMDENKYITVVFEEHRYTLDVTWEGEGSVNIEPDKEEYEPNEQVALTAEPDEHWNFVEWTGDHTGKEEEITITMDENKDITALFEIDQWDLNIDVVGNGRTEPEEGTHTYDHGEVVTIEAIEDHYGWYFSHWEGDHESDDEEITIEMGEDRDITAVFEIQEYELTIDIEGEGSTDPEEGTHTYEHGEEHILEATADEHWYFSHWEGDVPEGEEEEDRILITMESDKSIKAVFEINEYELIIDIDGEGGTTEPREGNDTYVYGEQVTLRAAAEEGWYFSHWEGDVSEGEEEQEEITITVDGNKQITAHFEEEEDDSLLGIWFLWLISLIVVLIILLLFIMKRKEEEPVDEDEDDTRFMKEVIELQKAKSDSETELDLDDAPSQEEEEYTADNLETELEEELFKEN